jgi:streptomycin 6-kinase
MRGNQLAIPRNLAIAAEGEGRQDWLRTLPRTIELLEERWALRVGEPYQPGGQTAWVAPANQHGVDVVLKVLWRHPEAEHEADALSLWRGEGAVLLYAAMEIDAHTTALLLERCRPGTTLEARAEPEQDVVVAGLLRRLWRQPMPGHRFPSLQSMCDHWAAEFEKKTAEGASIDPGLAREGLALVRELPRTAKREVLLCTDLHAGNVLAAEREPWLVIDPKPYVGDPTYDALQHLLNCDGRLREDPHALVSRMAELLGLDSDRLLLWLFARCVVELPDWPNLGWVAGLIAPG